MASTIDLLKPTSVVRPSSCLKGLRENFTAAKTEIEALQSAVSALETADANSVKLKVVTGVSGALTVADHSGALLVTSGNVTVPTTAGFHAQIVAGGAHTVAFNSTTSAAMAAGDVMQVMVQSATVIRAILVAAADQVAFT